MTQTYDAHDARCCAFGLVQAEVESEAEAGVGSARWTLVYSWPSVNNPGQGQGQGQEER